MYWPTALSILWPLAFVAALSLPSFGLAAVGVGLVLLFWGLSVSVVLVIAIAFAAKRDWFRLSAMLPLPLTTMLVIIAACFNLTFVISVVSLASDDLQLLVTLPTYSRQIANLPHQEGPRIATFLWRDLNGFGLAFGYEFLVYDESDEVVLPAEQRSAAWKKNAGSDLRCKLSGVYHAFGHYYFVGHGVDC